MKKLVPIVVVLVLVLLVAPWGIGKLAEERLDHGLDVLAANAPYMSITERKYTRGWFHSEQDVTIDLFGSWARAIAASPVASVDHGSRDGFIRTAAQTKLAGQTAAQAAAAQAAAESAAESAAPPEPDNSGSAQDSKMLEALKGMHITVHNDILHGPVLGMTGFGIARVNSRIVWPEDVRKKLVEAFGEDEVVKVISRIGFLGGGTTTLSMDKRAVKDKGNEISWDDLKLAFTYSAKGEHGSVEGKWPRFEVNDADGTHFVMKEFKTDIKVERIVEDLYDTDGDMSIDSIHVSGKDNVDVKDVLYRFDTDKHGDFVDMSLKLGTGPITSKELTLKEAHFDYSVHRLHIDTLSKFAAAMKKVYAAPVASAKDIQAAIVAPYKEYGIALLKYDPDLTFDRIMISTPEGDGVLKGTIKFKGVTAADFSAGGAMGLVPKIDAVFDIDVSEAMLAKLSGNPGAAGGAVDAGYLTRKDGHLVSHIEFKAGALTINGKPQALPGMGGPPPTPAQ